MQHKNIHIKLVQDKQANDLFIQLPFQLYQHEPMWVPPLLSDEYKFHNPLKNLAHAQATTCRWIAYRNNRPAGRIMGIIHHTYNSLHHERTARFYQFDCINDPSIAQALLHAVETWALEQGMHRLIGPFGFSDKDPQGLLVEGYDHLPVIAAPANPAYLPQLLMDLGYSKETDCVSYRINIPSEFPPVYNRMLNRLEKNNQGLQLLECHSRKQLKPFILPVFKLINETYTPLFGFVPMQEAEMKAMAKQYLPALDPTFVKLVVNEHQELIAFVIAMPDMSPGLQKAKGKLFPFGFIHILSAMRKTHQLNLLLGAIHPHYRAKGLDVWMGVSLMRSAIKKQFTTMDSHLILETNKAMRAECERLGGEVYKRFRIFQKKL